MYKTDGLNKKNIMKNSIMAQGDILIIPVDDIPSGLPNKNSNDGKIILAEGEITGHNHTILDNSLEGAWVDEKDNVWLQVKELLNTVPSINHQEHDKIDLQPGRKYKIVKQQEYISPIIKPRPVGD